jgi:hypothetical protein
MMAGLSPLMVMVGGVVAGVAPQNAPGMAVAGRRGGIRGRLTSHVKSKRKGKRWTHFSAFEVWDNIRQEEVAELEGLFRHIYRKDPDANRLNIQRGFKKARQLEEIPPKNNNAGVRDRSRMAEKAKRLRLTRARH